MRVVVVGAGLGGLSAACHLSHEHDVTLIEREAVPGGRAGVITQDGFRMDTGPTVMTMSGILSDAFSAAGAEMTDHVDLRPLDPMYRACFEDGSEINCVRGADAMRNEIARTCGAKDAQGFERFCNWLRRLYRLEMPNFIDRNFDGPLDLMRPASAMYGLLRMGGMRRLASVVDDHFDDERLKKLFSFQAMYAGLSPFQALAIYGVITYMDCLEGVWFPTGGMHSVAEGLATAAHKAGVDIKYSTPVESVTRKGNRVTGVRTTDGEHIGADAVVLNPDLPVAYRELVRDIPVPRVARTGNYSPSCLTWIAGVHGEMPKHAAHHNIHFAGQWRGAFDALLNKGMPMPDPSILVTVPTVSDVSLAPSGAHCIYALEPMPNLDGAFDWKRNGAERKDRLIEHVASLGYPVDAEIERSIDPLAWQHMGMERGTPFALSHKLMQTGPFRPRNAEKRLPGLFFVGSGTVPGVGIPMVLTSGKLVAERVNSWSSI